MVAARHEMRHFSQAPNLPAATLCNDLSEQFLQPATVATPCSQQFMSFIEDIIIRVDRELSACKPSSSCMACMAAAPAQAAARPAISEGRRTDGLIRESARSKRGGGQSAGGWTGEEMQSTLQHLLPTCSL